MGDNLTKGIISNINTKQTKS